MMLPSGSSWVISMWGQSAVGFCSVPKSCSVEPRQSDAMKSLVRKRFTLTISCWRLSSGGSGCAAYVSANCCGCVSKDVNVNVLRTLVSLKCFAHQWSNS